MADIKKFLDSDGLAILCRKLQDYPNNEILGTVINAIDNTKVDKVEGKNLSTNDYTNEDKNKLNSSLLYTEQTLTEEQQLTARQNIGAADVTIEETVRKNEIEIFGFGDGIVSRVYRVTFNAVWNTNKNELSESASLAEIRFYDADGNACEIESIAADSVYGADYTADKAIDGDFTTIWSSKNDASVQHWLMVTFATAISPTQLGICLREDYRYGIIDEMTVEALAEDGTWFEAAHITGAKDGWDGQTERRFDLKYRLQSLEEKYGKTGAIATDGAVLYIPQELTDVQQAQARTNISAADASTVEMLDGLINGRDYIEKHESQVNVITTTDLNESHFYVDIPAGVYYTMTLIQNGEIKKSYGISLYEVDENGKTTNVGILKESENWKISKAAGVDVKQFKLYAGKGIFIKDGTLTLKLEIHRSTNGSVMEKLEKLEADNVHLLTDNHFMLYTDKVIRGQDGNITDYTNWICTDYVDLTRRTGDTVTLTTTIYSGFGLAFYDKRYVYISGVSGINAADYGLTGNSTPQRVTLPLPEGCCYLRATMQMDKYGSGTRFNVTYPSTEVRAYYEIPEYYHADCYFEKKYNRINELMWNSMVNGDAFIFITDEHWANERGYVSNNQGNSIGLLQCLHDYLRIPRLFSGGDTGEYGSGLFANLLRENFGGDIHHVMGNHDYFNQDNQNASLYMQMDLGRENQIGNHKRHYYYVDNQHQKIRYIVLSAFAWNEGGEGSPATNGYEPEQLEWLKNEALDVGADWTVLIFTHSLNGAVETVDNEWAQAIDAKNTNHNIAAILQGHQHFDWIAHTAGGIPVITTTCDKNLDMEDYRPNGTIKEQAFDVCILDKETRKLTMVRIGCPVMEGAVEENWTLSEERVVMY